MDLFTITILSIFLIVIIIGIGMSYLDQGLDSLRYNGSTNKNHYDYYQNPLNKINSKYFHYRPKGTVIISKKKWEEIEKNIGLRISDATEKGKIIGRRENMKEIQNAVKNAKDKVSPTSPYLLLGVKSTDSLGGIEKRYDSLIIKYDPNNFVDLDLAFVNLARIRRQQLTSAWNSIRTDFSQRTRGGKL